MAGAPVSWPDEVDEVIRGDLTAAAAYVTPAGGAVVTGICPMGLERREAAEVGFTTSLGFGKKLERIIADPQVALAYHSREHGFSASPAFVLAQGTASVDIRPSRERLEAIIPQGQRYVGQVMRGPVWDRLLREYYYERVFVDITAARIAAWPDLSASGDPAVYGAAWPGPPGPQAPPKNGTGPRVDVDRAAGRIAVLPRAAPARRPPRRPARPRLPAAVDRTRHPDLHRMAGRRQRRHRPLRPPHVQGLRGAAPQETAAGLQWAILQVRALAGPPPGHRRQTGTAGRRERLPAGTQLKPARASPGASKTRSHPGHTPALLSRDRVGGSARIPVMCAR